MVCSGWRVPRLHTTDSTWSSTARSAWNLKGTLTGVICENPHAYLQMEVKGAGGNTVAWRLEMITPNALKRNRTTWAGLHRQHREGHECPCRPPVDGDSRGAAEYIKLADGILREFVTDSGARHDSGQAEFLRSSEMRRTAGVVAAVVCLLLVPLVASAARAAGT